MSSLSKSSLNSKVKLSVGELPEEEVELELEELELDELELDELELDELEVEELDELELEELPPAGSPGVCDAPQATNTLALKIVNAGLHLAKCVIRMISRLWLIYKFCCSRSGASCL